MSLFEFLILLIIAGICGSLAQALVGYSHGGCLVAIVLGLIGSLLGSWLARQLGLHEILALEIGGERFPVVWSIVGAAIFVSFIGLLNRRPRI